MNKSVEGDSAERRLAHTLKKVETEVRKVEGDGLGHWAYFLSAEAFSIEHNHQREDPGAPLTLKRLEGIRSAIDKSPSAGSEVAGEARVLIAECEERARKLPPHRNVTTAIHLRKWADEQASIGRPAVVPARRFERAAPIAVNSDKASIEGQQSAPPQAPKEVETSQQSALHVVRHSTKVRSRRDSITVKIEAVQPQCKDPKDTAEVWMYLLDGAQKEETPFLGAFDKGLKYMKDGSKEAYFTREALDKRLHPEKRERRRNPPLGAA